MKCRIGVLNQRHIWILFCWIATLDFDQIVAPTIRIAYFLVQLVRAWIRIVLLAKGFRWMIIEIFVLIMFLMSMTVMMMMMMMATYKIVRIRTFQNRIVLGHFAQTSIVERKQIGVVFQLVVHALCSQGQSRFVSPLERFGLLLVALFLVGALICCYCCCCLHARIQRPCYAYVW